MKTSSETRKHRGFSEKSWVGVEHQVRSDVGACELMQTHLSAGHCRWIGRPGGKRPGIVCEEAIRRDLSVYLAVNAVATLLEIYDDPTRELWSRLGLVLGRFKIQRLCGRCGLWSTRMIIIEAALLELFENIIA